MSDPGGAGPDDPDRGDPAARPSYSPAPGGGQVDPPPYPGYRQHPGVGPPAFPAAPWSEPVPKGGLSVLALVALLTGLLLPLIGLLIALPLGIIALVQIPKKRQSGRWMAITGIVLAVLWWVGFIVLGVLLASQGVERDDSGQIVEEGTIAFADIEVGDCLDIDDPEDEGDTGIEGVPCGDEHDIQAVSRIAVPTEGYSDALADRSVDRQCAQDVVRALQEAGETQLRDYRSYLLFPIESGWDRDGGNEILCAVAQRDFEELTGTLVVTR